MSKITSKITKQLAIPLSNNYLLPNNFVLVKTSGNCTFEHR